MLPAGASLGMAVLLSWGEPAPCRATAAAGLIPVYRRMLSLMANLPRTLNPALNSTGYMAAAGAVYAAVSMLYNVSHHDGVLNVPIILAAVAAIGALLTRQVVTPVADPVDGAGRPLVPKDDSVAALLSRGMAGVELGALNALRSEAGLAPLSQEAHTIPLEPAEASRVVFDDHPPTVTPLLDSPAAPEPL